MSAATHDKQIKINRHRHPTFWYRWNINPYSSLAVQRGQRGSTVETLPARLDSYLSGRRLKLSDSALIGGAIDPYIVIEKKKRITRRCLEVLAKHGCSVTLSTGSTLVLRDIDLIRELHEDSLATVGIRVPLDFLLRRRNGANSSSTREKIALLERVCRSGIQTGMIIETTAGLDFSKQRLRPVFKFGAEINIDFIHIPSLNIPGNKSHPKRRTFEKSGEEYASERGPVSDKKIGLRLRKSILELAEIYKVRLIPRRFLPFDNRRENFWLAESLANQAFFLEMSGINASAHWAAARKIDRFDGDVRLWALRGEFAPITSASPAVQYDVQRLLQGERNIHLAGVNL